MHGRRSFLIAAVAVAGLTLAACGDSNPASPSGAAGVTVSGVLLGDGAAFTASSRDGSGGGPITVVVEGTSISVEISSNGTFELDDVPGGTFTLVFYQDDVKIGEVTVTAADGSVVEIVVKVEVSVVVVVQLKVDGEIEDHDDDHDDEHDDDHDDEDDDDHDDEDDDDHDDD